MEPLDDNSPVPYLIGTGLGDTMTSLECPSLLRLLLYHSFFCFTLFCKGCIVLAFTYPCVTLCYAVPQSKIFMLHVIYSPFLQPDATAHRFLTEIDCFGFPCGYVKHAAILCAVHCFTMSCQVIVTGKQIGRAHV